MQVLAAGSLRRVWPQLMAHFPETVNTQFGPAGLLRERIETGEPCDLFASANLAHPQALLDAGKTLEVMPFVSNRLCLTVRRDALQEGDDWFSLLTRRDLRIATSTAGADPSGDYTQELFTRMGEVGIAVRQRANALVGGRDSAPVPQGRLAAEWLITGGQADLFIGYASYAPALREIAGLAVVDIPASVNPPVQYALALITPQARRLVDFLLSGEAKRIVREAGFGE